MVDDAVLDGGSGIDGGGGCGAAGLGVLVRILVQLILVRLLAMAQCKESRLRREETPSFEVTVPLLRSCTADSVWLRSVLLERQAGQEETSSIKQRRIVFG